MAEPSKTFKAFLGTDNTSDLAADRIKGRGIYLYETDNVDIDDNGKPHRRDGYGSQVVDSTTIHSWWSDGVTGLFVDGTTLKRLNTDYSVTSLITGIDPSDRMVYVKVNNQIFFSNNSIVGYIVDGLPYPFTDPNREFKIKMVGGQILEFYNSRLYAASGANLFFSDATIFTQMDKRKNAIAFPGRITMVKAVSGGLYVSADDKTFWLEGDSPFSPFRQTQVSDLGAIEGTAITVDGDYIKGKIQGRTVYWTDSGGCVQKGFPGGIITQLQDGLFALSDLVKGTAILKDDHGYSQYVAICEMTPGIGGASGEITIPVPIAE
jgi:hypothetical protein